jgi:hypothetical protein
MFAAITASGAIADEPAIVIAYFDALSGDSDQYEIVRGTEIIPGVQIRTELQQGDFIRIEESGNTAVIQFTDGSREELGPVAGLYGPYAERGSETTLLSNLLSALWGTVSDFRSRPVETVATAARGEGGPIVMGRLFTDFPLVLAEGDRSLFIRWGGGKAPYRVRVTQNGDAAIVEAEGIEAQHFRSEPIELSAGNYTVEITDAENRFGFSFQVTTVDDLPDEIPITNVPAAVADYLNAYALAVAADTAWAFESYQRLAELAEQGYVPASLLMQDIEEGEARYWEIPNAADSLENPPQEYVAPEQTASAALGDSRSDAELDAVEMRSLLEQAWNIEQTNQQIFDGTASGEDESRLSGTGSPDWSHPYYWAPFILMGNWL